MSRVPTAPEPGQGWAPNTLATPDRGPLAGSPEVTGREPGEDTALRKMIRLYRVAHRLIREVKRLDLRYPARRQRRGYDVFVGRYVDLLILWRDFGVGIGLEELEGWDPYLTLLEQWLWNWEYLVSPIIDFISAGSQDNPSFHTYAGTAASLLQNDIALAEQIIVWYQLPPPPGG